MCTYVRIYRNNDDNITNPTYIGEIETTNNVAQPEHVYDVVKYDSMDIKKELKPKHKVPPNVLHNFPKYASRDADCASIKSDEISSSESRAYCMPDVNKENTTHVNNPIPLPPKPKYTKRPIATPGTKAHHHLPTNEYKPLNDDTAMSDAKLTTENQYTVLDKTRRDESNQYALPVAPQRADYQELVGKPPRPSKYTIPRKTPNTN